MTARTQRRAAERKTRKAEEKKLRNQAQNAQLKAVAEPSDAPVLARELHLTATAVSAASPVSESQLSANRANAKLSRGPVSEAGKAVSAMNNFRHGLARSEGDPILLESESKAEYAQFLAGYQSEWQPQTTTENELVHRLVTHSWLRRRSLVLQKLFLCAEDGLITDERRFNLYRRYEVQHERAFNKALSDLMRLRSLRLREQNGFESQQRKEEKHQYQIRALQHREKLQGMAILNAEARLTLAQNRLLSAGLLNTHPDAIAELTETYQVKPPASA